MNKFERAQESIKHDHKGKFTLNGYTVEVTGYDLIDGGIQLFARAWKKGKQIGFGDGTVEIERFRFFNPPLYIDHPQGEVSREFIDVGTKEKRMRTLKYDPVQALRESLVHAISITGKEGTRIVSGKVGNTTDTFFAGSGDGYSASWDASSAWATAHDAASGNDTSATGTNFYCGYTSRPGTTSYEIARLFLPFDTSSLPDTDVISSATLSVCSTGTKFNQDNDGDDFIVVVQTSQASNTTLANSDYSLCGSAVSNPTEGSSRLDLGSFTATDGVYNDFALNATGISWVSKTGFTKLGMREGHDVINSAIANSSANGAVVYLSEQTGTSKDPKLTVVHAAPSNSRFLMFM